MSTRTHHQLVGWQARLVHGRSHLGHTQGQPWRRSAAGPATMAVWWRIHACSNTERHLARERPLPVAVGASAGVALLRAQACARVAYRKLGPGRPVALSSLDKATFASPLKYSGWRSVEGREVAACTDVLQNALLPFLSAHRRLVPETQPMSGKEDPFRAVVGGTLNLKGAKGALAVQGGGISKKAAPPPHPGGGSAAAAVAGQRDNRTAAEKAYEARLALKEAKDAAKAAQTTHRQKVAAFNDSLARLSEHHDIPRVGPG